MLRLLIRRAVPAASVSTSIVRSWPAISPSSLPPPHKIPLAPLSSVVDAHRIANREAKGKKKGQKALKKGKGGASPNASEEATTITSAPVESGLVVDPVEYDPVLDVGPGGRSLLTKAKSIAILNRNDVNTYMDFSLEDLNEKLPEGLPPGMMKEFGETRRCGLLIRHCFLDLRDNFRRVVNPSSYTSSKSPKVQKQIVLDGPVSCGKSIALAMLVHWARSEGWLVLYVPKGKEWTHGGTFYRNPDTNLFDTPVQATKILQDFLKSNEPKLRERPCQIPDPIPLGGEDAITTGKGGLMALPEGATLFDLIHSGITYKDVSVGVAVRLRKELALVKDIPVLFAIDQYNSWFTFSEYEEKITVHSRKPVHAKYLSTVSAYRSMLHDDMMVGAFSHSTAVGKLRQDLPDVPSGARVLFPRYSLDEAETVCHYYLRQKLIRRESFSEEKWKRIYYLANGNGAEMRWLVPFI